MSKYTTQEVAIGYILAILFLLPLFCGALWCEGYAIITGVNYLARKELLPATHSGYFSMGVLFCMASGVLKGRSGKSD